MNQITEIMRRIKSVKYARGAYCELAAYEIKRRTNSHFFDDEIRQVFEEFRDDTALIKCIISLKIVSVSEMRRHIAHTFTFDPSVCECAANHYAKHEEFIQWLMPKLTRKDRSTARSTLTVLAPRLSEESLWIIEERSKDSHISQLVSREISKRIRKAPEPVYYAIAA